MPSFAQASNAKATPRLCSAAVATSQAVAIHARTQLQTAAGARRRYARAGASCALRRRHQEAARLSGATDGICSTCHLWVGVYNSPTVSPTKASRATRDGVVDSNRQAVASLAVVCSVTLLSWGAALVACNDRTRPVVAPAPLPLASFQREAKSAALELAHRLFTGDFEAAAQLSRGAASERVQAARERCKVAPNECPPAPSGAVTRAQLLSKEGARSRVRAETFVPGRDGLERAQSMLLEVASTTHGPAWVTHYELEPVPR